MRSSFLGVALLAVAIPNLHGGQACAAERSSPWYMGAGAGSAALSVNSSQLNSIVSSIGGDGTERLDSGDSGIRVYGGFRVNKFFALEAGYADLGKIAFAVRPLACSGICPAVVTFPGSGEITAEGWSLGAVGTLPLTERFELDGRLGVFRSTVKLRARGPASAFSFPDFTPLSPSLDTTVHRTRPLIGAEIRYRVTPAFSFTLNWERINKLGSAEKTGEMDVRLLSVGVKYDF